MTTKNPLTEARKDLPGHCSRCGKEDNSCVCKTWFGSEPKCDLGPAIHQRDHDLNGEVVDGRTQMGPWAMMCLACHHRYGVGLGPGRGQRYELDGDVWFKVEG